MKHAMLAAVAAVAMAGAAEAATVTFYATGVAGISGFVAFDDTTFDGSPNQFVSNTAITNLSLDVFGELFSLADVNTGASTLIDSSGATPIINNGAGVLADNGSKVISFFPDGFDGTATDGNASLEFADAFSQGPYYAVNWSTVAPGVIPLPATLPLMLGGLVLAGVACRRRAA